VPEIIESPELVEFMLDFHRRILANEDSVYSSTSSSPYLTFIGSDAEEWWIGREAILAKRQQNAEMPRQEMRNHEVTAFSAGDIGWIVLRHEFRTGSGPWASIRQTVIMNKEDGRWKIIHSHNSIGRSNAEALGVHLTTNIERITEMVRADRPELRSSLSSEGSVTIVFTDIENSTQLLDRVGDDRFQQVLIWHDDLMATTVRKWGGQVVKTLGDGAMLAFPAVTKGLSASLEIRRQIARGRGIRHIRVRAGLHSGQALRREDDFFGKTVVMAARICSLANGGEVLVSDEVGSLAGSDPQFTFGRRIPARLKGLEGEFFVRKANAVSQKS
jgi:class 3 adenylate cyclase